MKALLLVLTFASFAVAAPPAQFESRGIGGGGAMYSPTINPADPKTMSVACDMSPQFLTHDGGQHWNLIDFRQLQSGHECALRFTRDLKTIWAINYASKAGGDQAHPARSSDGGKTFEALPAWPEDRGAWVLYADYDNPQRAIVSADYRELWITLDGGKTFDKKLSLSGEPGLHLAGVFFDGNDIDVGLNDGLYESHDGGKTFAKSSATGLEGNFISSFAGAKSNGKARLFCVTLKKGWCGITGEEHGAYTGVWTLDPGQKQWVKKTTGIPAGVEPFFVKMAANDPDTVYVAGGSQASSPTVYKTTDGGATWSDVFLTDGNKNIVTAWAGAQDDHGWSFGEYALGFDVCASDKNHLLLTTLGDCHGSDDGGKTWHALYTTPLKPRPIGIAPRGAEYVGNGMEVTSIWQIHWFDPTHLFACATDIRGFRSGDGGKSWSFDYAGDNFNTMYHAVTDPASHITYAAVSSIHDMYQSTYLADNRIDRGQGGVLASSDNGATWKPIGHLNKPTVWVTADPAHPHRLYASAVNSKQGGIYVTDDAEKGAEANWKLLPAPPRTQGHPFNILVLNDGALLCTYSGRREGKDFTPSSGVFLSSDGGQTWEDRSDPNLRFWTKDLVLDPADAKQNTWYACVFFAWGHAGGQAKSGLYRTPDRGKTWQCLADNSISPSKLLNVESCAFDPQHAGEFYFTTEGDGLFYCPNVRVAKPAFESVASYPFRHPLRVQWNPSKPGEMWVTSFGNGTWFGQTR